nr:hypothetical protein CFP56_71751 [Quercus suber]
MTRLEAERKYQSARSKSTANAATQYRTKCVAKVQSRNTTARLTSQKVAVRSTAAIAAKSFQVGVSNLTSLWLPTSSAAVPRLRVACDLCLDVDADLIRPGARDVVSTNLLRLSRVFGNKSQTKLLRLSRGEVQGVRDSLL